MVYFNLGIAYERKGLLDEAIEEYRAAIRLKPADGAFHQNLENALAKRMSRKTQD